MYLFSIHFCFFFFGHKKRSIFLTLWPSFVVSIFILLFLQINVNMNMSYRRETQNNMKIVLGSRQEVVVQIFPCRWSPGKFLLHHRYQLAADFVDLIASKKIGYFAGG